MTAERRAALLQILARTGSARIVDLAAELEISVATARRDVEALRRTGQLSRRHGYALLDHQLPARLRPASTDAIGMLVASNNRYLRLIGRAAQRESERRGLRFITELISPGDQTDISSRRLIDAGCVGLIYAPQWGTAAERHEPAPWLLDRSTPVVLAGREAPLGAPLFQLDSVIADHAYAMRLAVDHLHQLGHRRVLASIRPGTPPSALLAKRFVVDLERLGMPLLATPFDTPAVTDPPVAYRPIIDAIRTLNATAMIMHTDDSAQVLVHHLRAAGMSVPGDCSVVGYDDIVGPVEGVALTSVSPPKHQLGIEAVSLLMRRLLRARAGLERAPTAHLRLLPELVVRPSTGPPRSSRTDG